MRAAASLAFFRRHLHQCNSGIGPHLQHQPRRYASRPHSDHLARARALVTLSPYRYRPRGSAEEAQARHGGGEAVLDPAEAGTVRCAANHAPLTPISFVERAAAVYGRRPAVVYGERRRTWSEVRGRCVRLAAALVTHFGVARGDVVAVLSPNVPAMYELHFAVPMAGAVLCTLNTRHDAAMLSVLLKHSGAKVFFVESHLLDVGRAALKLLAESSPASLPALLTTTDDDGEPGGAAASGRRTCTDYEDLIKNAPSQFDIRWPVNELDPISQIHSRERSLLSV